MRRRTVLALAAGVGAAGVLGACSSPRATQADRIMVPNQPGGGYDATARAAAKVMAATGITPTRMDVFNLPGGSGGTAMSRLAGERCNGHLVLMMGLGLVGALVGLGRQAELLEATAVGRLVTEPGVFMVPKDSPIGDLEDLLRRWRRRPGSVRIGGGSALGGPDHLLPLLLARRVGIDPSAVRFVAHDGGGGLMPSLLEGKVDVGVSGAGEYLPHIAAGGVRVLAVSGEGASTLAGVNAPTLGAAGYPVDFVNWRGLLAPPGVGHAELAAWRRRWERLDAAREWEATCASYGWSRAALGEGDFRAFLSGQVQRVSGLLEEFAVTGRSGA
jgi:putative tricarboxylic transport membrane protein